MNWIYFAITLGVGNIITGIILTNVSIAVFGIGILAGGLYIALEGAKK